MYWKETLEEINKAGLIRENFFQGKNNYKGGGSFYGLFLSTWKKICWNIFKYDFIEEHGIFKVFASVSETLDRKDSFKVLS